MLTQTLKGNVGSPTGRCCTPYVLVLGLRWRWLLVALD